MISGLCNTGTWGFLGDFGLWGWIGLILNLVVWVGLLAGLALLVVWVIRRARTAPPAGGGNTAREILQARFARGEITREQFELMKQDIG